MLSQLGDQAASIVPNFAGLYFDSNNKLCARRVSYFGWRTSLNIGLRSVHAELVPPRVTLHSFSMEGETHASLAA